MISLQPVPPAKRIHNIFDEKTIQFVITAQQNANDQCAMVTMSMVLLVLVPSLLDEVSRLDIDV